MKIGFPTHPRNDVVKEIEWIGQNGFSFVDLFLEPDLSENRLNTKEIHNVLDDFNLGLIGHTAWYLPIGSPMKSLRQAAVDIMCRQMDDLAELNCPKVTVHANWPPGLYDSGEGIAFQNQSLLTLVKEAGFRNMRLLYESLTTQMDNLINISKILKANPEMEFHADLGHLNLHGRSPEEYVTFFKDRLGHVHLHDNNGVWDLHLPMGAGRIDWLSLIGALKRVYDGTITLEIFSRDRDYALLSRKKLERMWQESD